MGTSYRKKWYILGYPPTYRRFFLLRASGFPKTLLVLVVESVMVSGVNLTVEGWVRYNGSMTKEILNELPTIIARREAKRASLDKLKTKETNLDASIMVFERSLEETRKSIAERENELAELDELVAKYSELDSELDGVLGQMQEMIAGYEWKPGMAEEEKLDNSKEYVGLRERSFELKRELLEIVKQANRVYYNRRA